MSSILLRCSLGDLDVHELAASRHPARGNWVSRDIRIAWPSMPAEGSPAKLVFVRADGAEDVFSGTVRTSRRVKDTERVSVTLVGGAGRLLTEIPPAHHSYGTATVPAGVVLASIIAATADPDQGIAGEQLAAGVEAALDAYPLAMWTRVRMPARDAIDILADRLGLGWRMLPDGTIWMGIETWTPAVIPSWCVRTTGEPEDGVVVYEPDAGAPLIGGTTIDELRAIEVCYAASHGKLLAMVREALPGDPVRAPRLDLYRASYPGTVKAQAADGTLEIACDDPRVSDERSGLRGIPARVDWPGTKITVPEGTRCRVEFEGADPRYAYARSIDQDTTGATKAIALKDDAVDSGTVTGLANLVTGVVTFTRTPPGGAPDAPSPTLAITGKITGPCHAYAKGKPAP